MTNGFKQAIGLLMFHNIPFEYGNCVYGEYLLGGQFAEDDWKWEIDSARTESGITFQPRYYSTKVNYEISVPDTIKEIIEIENKALTDGK